MGVFVLGNLTSQPISQNRELVGAPTLQAIEDLGWSKMAGVVGIDPTLSDTSASQKAYGLPDGWPILIDRRVVEADVVLIGSGIRASKLLLPGKLLAELPGAEKTDGLGI